MFARPTGVKPRNPHRGGRDVAFATPPNHRPCRLALDFGRRAGNLRHRLDRPARASGTDGPLLTIAAMPRDREASATPHRLAAPVLPLALLAVAVVAAQLALQPGATAWLSALALLATAGACLLVGALWVRQRLQPQLRESRIQHQLLGQLLDVWLWQSDAEHRLVRLQPPQGAPASAWVEGAFSGEQAWERFDDDAHSLRARMLSQAPLAELEVRPCNGIDRRRWALRGLPRFDSRGNFCGYLGVAWPTDQLAARLAAQQALDALLADAPVALCLAGRDPVGGDQVLLRANAAASRLLDPGNTLPARPRWEQVLAGLPEPLRAKVQALQPGQTAQEQGWTAWLAHIGKPGADSEGLLLALAPPADGASAGSAADQAAFAYTISHDLRAPIRVVEGFTRILKEDYARALDRIGNDHLDRVLAAAARMNHMIDALLSLSRLSTQPLARQPVNLSQVAQYVVDDLRRGAPEREASVHIAPGLQAQGDPTLLRMALENLIGNAWKYAAKAAHCEIRFEQSQQDGRPVFCVSDNGAGFDMRFADRLFGVFQRLHSSSDFPGTGVGLASVRRIVRRHGGDIWAESEVGHGARFYFTLPG
jgi:signal transduction histidine kinase